MPHGKIYCFIVTIAAAEAKHRMCEIYIIVDGNRKVSVAAIVLSIKEPMSSCSVLASFKGRTGSTC